uniref:Transmembrane protein 81 n=1 Tax=Pelusios castaneus TaxID=367368 RepID=A0A8C8SD54_9SAUR
MKTLENSFICGTLAFGFHLPLLMASLSKVKIPEQLKSAAGTVVVSTTPCSVTCGLGVKVDEICEVNSKGKRTFCKLHRSDCVANWICGLRHFTVPVGKPFELNCLTYEMIGVGTQAFRYSWRLASGIITTDDVLFKLFKTPSYVIKLSPAKESDAGTYRCDVQLKKTFKIVKRLYFGLKVIPHDVVELNFQKSLTPEQKLAAHEKAGIRWNITSIVGGWPRYSGQRRAWFVFLIGIGSGVTGGLLVGTGLYFLLQVCKKNRPVEE